MNVWHETNTKVHGNGKKHGIKSKQRFYSLFIFVKTLKIYCAMSGRTSHHMKIQITFQFTLHLSIQIVLRKVNHWLETWIFDVPWWWCCEQKIFYFNHNNIYIFDWKNKTHEKHEKWVGNLCHLSFIGIVSRTFLETRLKNAERKYTQTTKTTNK